LRNSLLKPPRKPERPRRPLRTFLRRAAEVVLILLALIMIAAMSGCCNRLFYLPDSREYSTPLEFGLQYDAVEFQSRDGTKLTGWFIHTVGEAKGTVVHCHGNAQNMTSHWQFVKFLPADGFNLFVFDYRGYGRSEGSPSRKGTIEDARAAVDHVMARKGVDPARVAIFGQSIGGAIATVVAAEDPRIRGAIIDSAFSSYRDEAAHAMRQNPITWLFAWPLSRVLIGSSFDPVDYVGKIAPRPVLFIHGVNDQVAPSKMSQTLMTAAGQPKELWLVPEARHTEAFYLQEKEYRRRIKALLDWAFAEPKAAKEGG
jgi:uncharacterized protein